VPDQLCEACGEPTARTSEFCAACGAYLGWQDRPADGAGPDPATAVLPLPAPEPTARPEPAPRARVEERLLADSRRTYAPLAEPAGGTPVPGPLPAPVPTPVGPLSSPVPPQVPRGPRCPSPSCGAANPPERRFCARCGTPMAAPAGVRPVPVGPPRLPARPRRNRPHRTEGSAASRQAYRQALPTRYRVLRGGAGTVVLLLLAGLLTLLDHSPATWAKARFYDLTGRTTTVDGVVAVQDPAAPADPEHPPGAVTDLDTATAWAVPWTAPAVGRAPTCGTPSGSSAPGLLLTLPGRVTLKEVKVVSGLPDQQRLLAWRPTLLRLTFDDGTCQQVPLTDTAGQQQHRLRSTTTSSMRLQVVGAAPPAPGGSHIVALTEVELLRRPG
jgi:hypothetical protein